MNGTDKKEISNLYVNLKEHFDALWIERKEQLNLHFALLRESLLEFKATIDKRLIELNELRREYTKDRTEDRTEFVRDEVYKGKIKEYDKWITEGNEKFTKLMTKYDSRLTLPILISLAALLLSAIGVVIILMKH